jgi:hypothetical protein
MANTLNSGEWLRPGQSLQSSNGYHVLAMQEDGNLVLYSLMKAEWASGTDGRTVAGVIMQDDGNLVIYAPDGQPIWDTGTHGHGPSRLEMQDDRNAVVYSAQGATWASNTNTDPELWQTRQIEISPELRAALQSDVNIAPIFKVGVKCTTTGPAVWFCVAAVVVIAVILEFTNGKPPFGPNNDLRVLGGEISDASKKAGRDISNWGKNQGGQISKTWKRWFS